jgi:hypothetical protein
VTGLAGYMSSTIFDLIFHYTLHLDRIISTKCCHVSRAMVGWTTPATGGAAPRLWASATSRLARRRFAHNEFDLRPRPTTTPRLTQQVLLQHRQHAYLRRYLQRPKDLPGQGAFCLSPSDPPHVRYPPSRARYDHRLAEGHCRCAIEGIDADGDNRVSCTSVATARSSASRTARPSPCSSSARTPVRSHGRLCTDGCTRRVSLRLVHPPRAHSTRHWGDADWVSRAMTSGASQHDLGHGIERSPRTPLPCCTTHHYGALANHRHPYRKSPRSAPAAQSSTSVPSSVPRST